MNMNMNMNIFGEGERIQFKHFIIDSHALISDTNVALTCLVYFWGVYSMLYIFMDAIYMYEYMELWTCNGSLINPLVGTWLTVTGSFIRTFRMRSAFAFSSS